MELYRREIDKGTMSPIEIDAVTNKLGSIGLADAEKEDYDHKWIGEMVSVDVRRDRLEL